MGLCPGRALGKFHHTCCHPGVQDRKEAAYDEKARDQHILRPGPVRAPVAAQRRESLVRFASISPAGQMQLQGYRPALQKKKKKLVRNVPAGTQDSRDSA